MDIYKEGMAPAATAVVIVFVFALGRALGSDFFGIAPPVTGLAERCLEWAVVGLIAAMAALALLPGPNYRRACIVSHAAIVCSIASALMLVAAWYAYARPDGSIPLNAAEAILGTALIASVLIAAAAAEIDIRLRASRKDDWPVV